MANLSNLINPSNLFSPNQGGIYNTTTTGQANQPLPASISPSGVTPSNFLGGSGFTVNQAGSLDKGPIYGPQKPAGPANPQVLGASNVPSYGVYGSASGQNSALQEIDNAYSANLQDLQNNENTTRAQYDLNQQVLGSQSDQALKQIQSTQDQQNAQLDQSKTGVQQSYTNALSDARQAYNELQQRNNATLSAAGISNSSAADAMQENLGRQTLQALNNISQNRDQVLSNIEQERTKATDFYSQQRANIATSLQQAQQQIQIQLQQALDGINNARNVAANQKAAARNQVIQGVQAAYASAQAQAAQYQQALDAWNQQKQGIMNIVGAVAQGSSSPQDFINKANALNQQALKMGYQIDIPSALNALTSSTPVQYQLYRPLTQDEIAAAQQQNPPQNTPQKKNGLFGLGLFGL